MTYLFFYFGIVGGSLFVGMRRQGYLSLRSLGEKKNKIQYRLAPIFCFGCYRPFGWHRHIPLIGDGIHDNTKALQHAMYLPGKTLYLPKGTYIVGGAITLRDVTLIGEGLGKSSLKFDNRI